MSNPLKPIKCRAAVMYAYEKPLVLEDVIIDAPKGDQVRVKLVSSGICLSDITSWKGKYQLSDGGQQVPIVLGHEGAGIVESIGENVTSVKPGDHVLTTYVSRCNDCNYCSSPLTNLCAKENLIVLGMIPNKKLPNGTALLSLAGLGTFSEYLLLKSCQVDKIDPLISLVNLSAITCATGSGFGAAKYLAKVVPGSSIAVWGSGAFGLNVMFAAKQNGAKNIIAIDVHSDRKHLAVHFGCTDFINPKQLDKPVSEYLVDKYGGIDYAFDCNGQPENVNDGIKALAPFGSFIFVALTYSDAQVLLSAGEIAFGKSILGGFFGNRRSDELYGEVLGLYKEAKYDLDKIITHKFKLDQINDAIESVSSGKSVKTLIVFD